MNKYIVDGDFVTIVSDKFIEQGVKRGRLAYIAGHRALPIAENDPYTQRIKFIVALCDGEHVNTTAHYLMDPDSLAKVSQSKQKKLEELIQLDFETNTDVPAN